MHGGAGVANAARRRAALAALSHVVGNKRGVYKIYIPASARKLQIFEERFIDAVQTDENTSKATQLFFKRMKLISERNKGFYAECD